MGIAEVMASFQNAWYTISGEGQPSYRVDDNGSTISKVIMAELANKTTKDYDITYQQNPYIEPDKPALYA